MRSKLKLPAPFPLPKAYLIAGAALVVGCAGVAQAASQKLHHMTLDGPGGQRIAVSYTGDVAPEVEVVPAVAHAEAPAMAPVDADSVMADPFVQMQRVSAMMDAEMRAMVQRSALMQRQTAALQAQALQQAKVTANGEPMAPGFTLTGTMPKGVQVTYYSSSTDANGCTRSVSYRSDGSGAKPQMVQAASDSCEAATAPSPAKAEAPQKAKPGTAV
ncbi:hypothetical protein MTR62_02275 [Novosphingobium sp. 1949]|uniref:Secreted protein n=1 Tax=Novosphingobium organovorum TaxID=2930092 RepID=A0ABT0B8Z3_9SPHN|nr:hypothetical protein [Novosphingobium organovorum]MCJ2181540.1 hypothetical protein [Novosphingobium organovorum]